MVRRAMVSIEKSNVVVAMKFCANILAAGGLPAVNSHPILALEIGPSWFLWPFLPCNKGNNSGFYTIDIYITISCRITFSLDALMFLRRLL